MSRHLLLVSVGPVQTFIAQAKRTRDLWLGSRLLSDVSRARRAQAIAGHAEIGADLPGRCERLRRVSPRQDPRPRGRRALPTWPRAPAKPARGRPSEALGASPARARRAHRSRRGRRSEGEDRVGARRPRRLGPLRGRRALRRRSRAGRGPASAGRKLLHDFAPWSKQRGDVHKSSLDGARETVLARDRRHPLFARYRIGPREELDAVGLLKRTAARTPSSSCRCRPSRPLRRGSRRRATCVRAERSGRSGRLARSAGSRAWNLRGRAWVASASPSTRRFSSPVACRSTSRDNRASRWRRPTRCWASRSPASSGPGASRSPSLMSPPCLVADGDRMGDAIRRAREGRPRGLTGTSPGRARRLRGQGEGHHVEAHDGVLVYAGGDDVLAFVAPSTRSPAPARARGRQVPRGDHG